MKQPHRHPNQVMTPEELEKFKQDFSTGLEFGFKAFKLIKSAFGRLAKDPTPEQTEQTEPERP